MDQLPNFEASCYGKVAHDSCISGPDLPHVNITLNGNQCVIIKLNHNIDHYITLHIKIMYMLHNYNMDICRVKNLQIVDKFKKEQLHKCKITGFLTGKLPMYNLILKVNGSSCG